jgi:hypothetical protein
MAKEKKDAEKASIILFVDVSQEAYTDPHWKNVEVGHALAIAYVGSPEGAIAWLEESHTRANVLAAEAVTKQAKHGISVVPANDTSKALVAHSGARVVSKEEADMDANSVHLRRMDIALSYTVKPHH